MHNQLIKTFLFSKESKENGELYGSIKPKEITNKIFEKSKIEIKPSQITLKEELNKVGIFEASINFHNCCTNFNKIEKHNQFNYTFPQMHKESVTLYFNLQDHLIK